MIYRNVLISISKLHLFLLIKGLLIDKELFENNIFIYKFDCGFNNFGKILNESFIKVIKTYKIFFLSFKNKLIYDNINFREVYFKIIN